MNSLEVWRSNRLVRASYELTLAEYRCMWQVLSGIYMKNGINPDTLYKIDLDSYATTWKLSRNQAYIDVNKGLKLLLLRTVTVRKEDILELEGKKSTDPIKWVDKVVLSKEGIPAIRWSTSVIPYLMNTKPSFTRLHKVSLIKLRKFNYIRLYEVFKRYEGIGKITFSVVELQDFIDIDIDRSCKSFGSLKSTKIDPALKAINEHTEIGVSYVKEDYKKQGRKVVKVTFSITRKEKKQVETRTKEIKALGLGDTKLNLPKFKGRSSSTSIN